jgi:hypothetical protein
MRDLKQGDILIMPEVNGKMKVLEADGYLLSLVNNFGQICGWVNKKQVADMGLKLYEPEIAPTDLVIDEPVEVSNDDQYWVKRHFARYKNEKVLCWSDGCTSFSSERTSTWDFWKRPEAGK